MTVWALPNSDLEMMAVRLPWRRASIAARSPAPPAPMTTTSYSWRSTSVMIIPSVEQSQVGNPACGYGHDVHVGQRDADQRDPRPLHVLGVELRHARPQLVADR